MTGVAHTNNRTKTSHHQLIINQRSNPARRRSEGKLPPLRPSLVCTNAATSLPSTTPGTQIVTHLLGRQGKGKHEGCLVRKRYPRKLTGEMLLTHPGIQPKQSAGNYFFNLAIIFAIQLIFLRFNYYFCNFVIISAIKLLQFSCYFCNLVIIFAIQFIFLQYSYYFCNLVFYFCNLGNIFAIQLFSFPKNFAYLGHHKIFLC